MSLLSARVSALDRNCPLLEEQLFKRIAARTAGVVGAAALSVGLIGAVPANAAGLDKAIHPGTEEDTYVRITKTVTDAGGQDFSVSVLFTETYLTEAGNFRVGAKVYINALGTDLDNDGPGDGGLDARVKVLQGYANGTTKLIQDKSFDGVSDPFVFDCANPLNRPGVTKILISAGTNDDGYRNSDYATIVQPIIGDEDPGADGEGVEAP